MQQRETSFQQLDERRIYGGQLEQDYASQLGNLAFDNTFGLQLRHDDVAGVGLRSTRARQYVADIRFDVLDQTSVSAYWQSEVRLTPNLRATTGLRYDRFDYRCARNRCSRCHHTYGQ